MPNAIATALVVMSIVHEAKALPEPRWVTLGDPGNPSLTEANIAINGIPNYGWDRGSVDQTFQIMRRPLSVAEWQRFAELLKPHWSFGPEFDVDCFYGWPNPDGSWGPDGQSDHWPAEVRLDVLAAYVNWLHNGRSSDPSTFFSGVYDFSEIEYNFFGGIDSMTLTRSPDARYWIPSIDEALKAGFYETRSADAPEGRWYAYANSSDDFLVPGPPGIGEMTGVFDFPNGTNLGQYADTQTPSGLIDWGRTACMWSDSTESTVTLRFGRFGSRHDGILGAGANANVLMFECNRAPPTVVAGVRVARSMIASVDLAPPFGVLDLGDVQAFVDQLIHRGPTSDLAPPYGVWDLSDVDTFIRTFRLDG